MFVMNESAVQNCETRMVAAGRSVVPAFAVECRRGYELRGSGLIATQLEIARSVYRKRFPVPMTALWRKM